MLNDEIKNQIEELIIELEIDTTHLQFQLEREKDRLQFVRLQIEIRRNNQLIGHLKNRIGRY